VAVNYDGIQIGALVTLNEEFIPMLLCRIGQTNAISNEFMSLRFFKPINEEDRKAVRNSRFLRRLSFG
jgi:hypothetical protein